MLIAPQQKAVLLRSRNPSRITAVIPTAKCVRLRGVDFVAVPHRTDETKVLRNLGYPVPAPIKHYYKWPGLFKPFHAQRETAAFLSLYDRAYCLNGLGTGKTVSALWAYDYRRSRKQSKRALVVAPLSTLERTWADEVFKHFPHLTASVLYGARERRLKLLNQEADIYIVNHHGLQMLAPALESRPDIDLVIYDELAVVRNIKTSLWKAADAVVNGPVRRAAWGLTGTPIPNAPTDAWGQCRLITPGAVPKYYGRFRDMVMRQVSEFRWVARDNALEAVRESMQPSIRFTIDECTDLPEQTFIERHAELTTDQQTAYKAMRDKLYAEFEGGGIMAVNEAVKLAKLVQICCGVAYGMHGDEVLIPAKPRLDVLDELIEASEGKTLVFVPFTGALTYVAEHIGKTHGVAIINGATPKLERDRIFGEFQNGGSIDVIVAQPATMSHGLTLTAATTVVWFAPITSNEVFEQANGRVRRPGQTRSTVIACITGTPVERAIFTRLKAKQSTQGAFLSLIDGGN